MVTDSILSAIIFKWAVINDVRVSRVLRVPGWMTSALLPCMLFKPPLFSLNTDAQPPAYTELAEMVAYELLISLSLFLCHIHTHTLRNGSRATSPQVQSIILTLQSIFIDFTINVLS